MGKKKSKKSWLIDLEELFHGWSGLPKIKDRKSSMPLNEKRAIEQNPEQLVLKAKEAQRAPKERDHEQN